MGDRANVAIVQEDNSRIFFYTHWRGTELIEDVHRALARGQRWGDGSYLARIIFCEMVGEKRVLEETGYGISNGIGDNSHPIIVVDPQRQKVWLETERGTNLTSEKSFEAFVKDIIELSAVYESPDTDWR